MKFFLLIIIFISTLANADYLNRYSLDNDFKIELKKYFKKVTRSRTISTIENFSLNINIDSFISLLNEHHQMTLDYYSDLSNVLDEIINQHNNNEAMRAYQHHQIRRGYVGYINSLHKVFKLASSLLPPSTDPDQLFIRDDHLEDRLLWLLAHSVLVNDYLLLCDLAYYNHYTRLYLNSTDLSYDIPINDLDTMNRYLNNSREVEYLKVLFKNFEQMTESNYENDNVDFIYDNLSSLKYYRLILDNDVYLNVSRPFARLFRRVNDDVFNVGSRVTFRISYLIGSFASKTEFRDDGYLLGNEEIKYLLLDHLKPLDVLTDKNFNRLSNYLITSHFGHAAIWLGTRQQLEKIGMWDHPIIEPFHEDIENGRVILESVPSGVRLGQLEHFMDTDQIAIFRHKGLLGNQLLMERVYFNGLIQLNKPYDSNFSVFNSGALICSEIVYQAMDFIDWDTDYVMWRYMITPDHVAQRTFIQEDFSMELYLAAEGVDEVYIRDIEYLKQVLK